MKLSLRYVFACSLLGILCTGAPAQWTPRYTIDCGGSGLSRITIARIRSVNGDTIPDLLVGLQDTATVLICSGRNGAEISRISIPGTNAGFAVASVPNLDGDPNDEILIGDTSGSAVYLWSPRAGGTNVLLAAWTPLSTAQGGSAYGASVAAADLDGDGRAELLIGAPGAANGAGLVEVVKVLPGSSTPQLLSVIPGQAGELFGMCVTTFGDQDGDGVAEVAVGGPRAFGMTIPAPAGTVRIYSGALLVSSVPPQFPLATLNGATANDQFGWALASVGDQDNDGRDDLAIGAPSDIDAPHSLVALTGFTVLGGLLQPHTIYTVVPSGTEAVGRGLASCEDYDGNGVKDFLVGVHRDYNDPNFNFHHGFVYILNTPRMIWMDASIPHSGHFGEAVESLGTVLGRRLAAVADRGVGKVFVF